MKRTATLPKNDEHWLKLRLQDITSSDISALFGLSRFNTHYSLWHEKKRGEIDDISHKDCIEIGDSVEDAIAGLYARKYFDNAPHKKSKKYYRIPGLNAGCSIDHIIDYGGDRLMEIKNVDLFEYMENWTKNEAPAYIELQVQHQLLVTGLPVAYICPFVGGNRMPKPIVREPVKEIQDAIRDKVSLFWESIESDQQPNPEVKTDAAAIIKVFNFSEPGKVMTGASDQLRSIAVRHKRLGTLKSRIEKEMEVTKARILMHIGDHEKVVDDVFKITAYMVEPKPIEAYTRKGYRTFRVTVPKKKGKKNVKSAS